MRDLTCTGFRMALYVTGAWMFITLWSGAATAGEQGLLAGAATASGLAGPVMLGWALAWAWPHLAAQVGSPDRMAPRRPRGDTVHRLTGTGTGVPRALALMVALMGLLLIAGEGGMAHLAGFRDLVPVDRAVPVSAQAVDALGEARHMAAFVEIGLFTAFALTFLVAAGLLRNELEARGGYGFRWSWRWTAVTLFIPVLNLIRPWLGLAEIDRAVTRTVDEEAFGNDWRRAGGFSLPTAVLALAWLLRFGAETTAAQAGATLTRIASSADWHDAVNGMIDSAGLRLGIDLLVMAVMVWWIWRLHLLIRRL